MPSKNGENISPYDKPSYEYYRVDLFVTFALFIIASIVFVLEVDIISIIILLTLMVLFFIRGTMGMYRYNKVRKRSEKKS